MDDRPCIVVYVDDGYPESAEYDDNYVLIARPVR